MSPQFGVLGLELRDFPLITTARASSVARRRECTGTEGCARVLHFILTTLCERMRSTEHLLRDPSNVLERRHGLAEIVERGAGVSVERRRVISSF